MPGPSPRAIIPAASPPAVAGTAHLAAIRLRDKLARIAASHAERAAGDSRVRRRPRPRARQSRQRCCRSAASPPPAHWAPATLPEGADSGAARDGVLDAAGSLTAPTEADEVNSSLCHGFIFDMCAVEVDRVTGAVAHRQLRHDARLRPHPAPGMVAGQVTGGFAQALGAALLRSMPTRLTAASSPAPSPTT